MLFQQSRPRTTSFVIADAFVENIDNSSTANIFLLGFSHLPINRILILFVAQIQNVEENHEGKKLN